MTIRPSAFVLPILLVAGLSGCAASPDEPGGGDATDVVDGADGTGAVVRAPSTGSVDAARPFERRGTALRRAGRLDAAEASFRRALAIDAGSVAAREGLGLVLLRRDNLALAEVMLERVLEIDGDRIGTLGALGVLRDRQGRHADAQARYREALALDGDDATVVNNLGYSLLLEGRLDDAERELERAVRLDPSLDIAWSNLALARTRAGDRPGAREALSQVGGRHETLNNLALLDLLSGDERQARSGLQASLASAPGYYAPAQRNLALLDGGAPRARARLFERAGLGDVPVGRVTVPRTGADDERPADSPAALRDDALLSGPPTIEAGRSILLRGDVDDSTGDGIEADADDATPSRSADRASVAGPPGTSADAIAASDQPIDDPGRDIVRDVQTRLADKGFAAGPVDGVVGRATTRAIRLFKAARGLPVDETITPRLLEELRR